jgi:hypothetical protein
MVMLMKRAVRTRRRRRLILHVSLWLGAVLVLYIPILWMVVRSRGAAPVAPTSPVALREAPQQKAPLTPAAPTQRAPEPPRATEPPPPAQPAASSATKPQPPPPAPPPSSPPVAVVRPEVPRHHAHIRIAMLAYHGNPMGPFEDDLLKNHVDLVIPDPINLKHVSAVAPQTPQLVYTNTSSLYTDLLLDWLTFADAAGASREEAFYHAKRPVKFRGDSPSSRPVTWFWRVYRGGTSLTEATNLVRPKSSASLAFGAPGESVCLGHPDRFREVNFELASGAGAGWSAAAEYPAAVDAEGRPTAWKALKLLSDTTAGLTRSGQVAFDPPADWKAAALGKGDHLYYVRFRTTAGGTAPAARSVLGRDYVGAGGKAEGVVPVFDTAADANGDGYLDDAEYARRAAGKDARFVHESRMPCATYGQMRPAANPSSAEFRKWAVDYHVRKAKQEPLAAGFFMDNSAGKPFVEAADVREPLADYAKDYGGLLAEISKAVAPRWVMGNSAGGPTYSDIVIRQNPAYLEEFAIRPLQHNFMQFEDLAATVARRARLTSPSPLGVLDGFPAGGDPTDPRTQLATLAEYYLLADPDSTFLMFFGGHEPATTWRRHWAPAAAYDVGRPTAPWSRLVEADDPSHAGMKYRVYRRTYERALVLFKPLSHKPGDWKVRPTLGDDTATTHDLGGSYRPLRADGTLGEAVTRVSLRNGEGAILIKGQP